MPKYKNYRVLVKAKHDTPQQCWCVNTYFAASEAEAVARSRKEYRQFEVHLAIGMAA